MENISVIGIDLAKNIFQLHGIDTNGKVILKKKLRRDRLVPFFSNLKPCLIGIEACSGAHYWKRTLDRLGHNVKIMAPQYVKPYVKTNKNDMADAEAICEAVTRPSMRFVPIKSERAQDIQSLHRARKRVVNCIVSLSNEIRGLLGEYGIVFAVGKKAFKDGVRKVVNSDQLSSHMKETLQDLFSEYLDHEIRLERYDERVKLHCNSSDSCKRLMKIRGVGPLTASILSTVDPNTFKNGREFAAWLGLTPKQVSSGGKEKLLGISKRGDSYIRQLLVHGGRIFIHYTDRKKDELSMWAKGVKERRGYNKASVAVANKLARICWSIMKNENEYQLSY